MRKGRVVYINGNFVPENEAKISIFDSALMFGDMVFEMTRSFNKKQFLLREHLIRLFTGLKILHINIKYNIDELEKLCYKVIKKNNPVFEDTDEHRLMINISRGPLSIYSQVFNNILEPTVVIADFPLKWTVVGDGKLFETGINMVVTSQRTIHSGLIDPKIKNRSRLHYQLANIEVSKVKGENNWALLLDEDGFIAEGTGCNFFIIKNNVIITPEGRNILRGVSRDYIFTLAKQLKIKCIEKNIEPYDVYTADESFVTATPFCLLPVTSINHQPIGNGKFSRISKLLLKTWSKNVGVDIIKQIKDFNNQVDEINLLNGVTPYQFSN